MKIWRNIKRIIDQICSSYRENELQIHELKIEIKLNSRIFGRNKEDSLDKLWKTFDKKLINIQWKKKNT